METALWVLVVLTILICYAAYEMLQASERVAAGDLVKMKES